MPLSLIFTIENLDSLDELANALKYLTINDAEYYESDKNDATGDPASDQKVPTHTSDGKKRKFTDTSNVNLQQNLLINWTLLIITTTIDPQIPDRVTTYGENPHVRTTPTTKRVITDATRRGAHILRNPGYVSRTDRGGTTPRKRDLAVRSPQEKSSVMIGCTTVLPNSGIMGIQEILSKHGSTGSAEIGDT